MMSITIRCCCTLLQSVSLCLMNSFMLLLRANVCASSSDMMFHAWLKTRTLRQVLLSMFENRYQHHQAFFGPRLRFRQTYIKRLSASGCCGKACRTVLLSRVSMGNRGKSVALSFKYTFIHLYRYLESIPCERSSNS